jgi:hypothetical protein
MFKDLFSLKTNKNEKLVDGYTIYAHNLGRFDSVLLIRVLCNDLEYQVKPI